MCKDNVFLGEDNVFYVFYFIYYADVLFVFLDKMYIVLNVFGYSFSKVNLYLPVSGTTKTSEDDEFGVELGLLVGCVSGTKD